jgi:hypothetical protein
VIETIHERSEESSTPVDTDGVLVDPAVIILAVPGDSPEQGDEEAA